MEHVVFFPGPDGSPAFRRTASLEDAVRFVEHLRNIEGVTEVSVHALSEVPLAFRAYYRVEMPTGAHAAAEAAPDAPAGVQVPMQPVIVEVAPVEAPAAPSLPQPVAELPTEPVAYDAAPEPIAEPVAEPAVEPIAEPVAEHVEPTPFVTPDPAPAFAPAADVVPNGAEQPVLNGRRSLGFFSH